MAEKNRVCPKCRENDHDTEGDHLFQMRDGKWGCFKNEYHSNGKPYIEGQDENREGEDETAVSTGDLMAMLTGDTGVLPSVPAPGFQSLETQDTPILSNTGPVTQTFRNIEPATFKKFMVSGEYKSGTLIGLRHTLHHSITSDPIVDKVRWFPKDFRVLGSTNDEPVQLFGQSIFPSSKRLLICEGELDAMSAWQMLQKWNVAVVSLPFGSNVKSLLDNKEYIAKQLKGKNELIFCCDNDTAGKKVEREFATLYPDAKFMRLQRKDANEYLEAKDQQSFIAAFWDADVWRPAAIVRVNDVITDVMKRPVIGREWPWPTLTKNTYGRRGGEGIFVGAGVKCGKSEWINQVLAHDCQRGWPIAAVKYEEQPAMTIKRVAGKVDGTFYHKPGLTYSDKNLEDTARSLQPNLFLHQAFGTSSASRWDDAKEYIKYAVTSGCKTVILDPITKITNGLTPSETETELRRFSDELACMAQDMDFFYIVTCHLKAPSSGASHERGGRVETYQFRGSRAMAENCYYFLGIERNKDPNLSEDERNTSQFVLLEDRAFGNTCKFPVVYNKITQSYLEAPISTSF